MTQFLTSALLWLAFFQAAPVSAKCVQVFYDSAPQAATPFRFGRVHAMYLQNLLGHFPKFQQIVAPIETYQKSQLERCEASIYLGNYYDNPIPAAFLEDFATTSRNVLWAGYNIWKLAPPTLDAIWGVKFEGLSTLDNEHLDEKGKPTFYKFYEYLGETFFKYGAFDLKNKERFNAAFEISLFTFTDEESKANVVSWARHSHTGERKPYVLRNANHWYIGDSPFSFATEDDRYLIAADLLFDVLEEKPRRPTGPRPALLRIEDVHPKMPVWTLYQVTKLLHRNRAPFSISLIPIYSDPLWVETRRDERNFVSALNQPAFLDFLKFAPEYGASFIYHGVTHQYHEKPNPFTAVSGDDFEFWNRVDNLPIVEDSPEYVVDRLEDGYEILARAQAAPAAWLTPHYQASPLDYLLFGQLFTWNIGRAIYFPLETKTVATLPENLRFDTGGLAAQGKRLPYLAKMSATYSKELEPAGQFFPYEIDGDVFGQRMIPENIGNIQPFMNEQVLRTLSVDDMIKTLRRNRVLRDTWASFFVHVSVFQNRFNGGVGDFAGDMRELERLVRTAQENGYEFIDLDKWVKQHRTAIRPTPVETLPSPASVPKEDPNS